jgi:hypothetical protein
VGSHAQADGSGSPLPQVSRKAQRALYLDSAAGDDGTGASLTVDSPNPKAPPSHLSKGQVREYHRPGFTLSPLVKTPRLWW